MLSVMRSQKMLHNACPTSDFYTTASEHERSLQMLETLLGVLVARRVVVAHYAEGSEPPALLYAALIPWLREEGLTVLPPISLGYTFDRPGYNRYLLSTLVSLEADFPPAERLSLGSLAALSLADYLAQRTTQRARLQGASSEQEHVLIFPAFEQVLTTNPDDLNAKYAFFAQLGIALRHGEYRALFVLPKTHIAALAPYRRLVPTCYRYTFCLDALPC